MKPTNVLFVSIAAACAVGAQPAYAADRLEYEWFTVVSNGDLVPGTTKYFNSYNQPAVNNDGRVVFRARSRGGQGPGQGQGQPEHGIYVRDLGEYGDIQTVFRRNGPVPSPTNPGSSGKLPTFNEFPSVPRIDAGSDTIATRGQSTPVWFDPVLGEIGTAGVYMNPGGVPTTGAAMLGHLEGFGRFQVPIPEAAGKRFDQFPGSPSVTERTTVVFKGNFTVAGEGKTGIFYRNVASDGGLAPVELVASSYTHIPGSETHFGSTAPPSAAGKYVVFAGYDDEGNPREGGIYRARLGNKPVVLETVIAVGDHVPGEADAHFTEFGEAVSLASNGRHVMFWGAWGSDPDDFREVALSCPEEGNAARYQFCLAETANAPYRNVHVHQGFFLKDMQLGALTALAKSGDAVDGTSILDFAYWNFSGRVPGMGEGDDIEETARWRASAFGAVSGHGTPNRVAFKARTADGQDAIYLRNVHPSGLGGILTLIKTGTSGAAVDPMTPAGALVSSVGIERDGFRGDWLAISVSMLAEGSSEEDTGWAGIYAARFIDDDAIVP